MPVARDGSMFTPDLKRGSSYTIGKKGSEKQVADFHYALSQLQHRPALFGAPECQRQLGVGGPGPLGTHRPGHLSRPLSGERRLERRPFHHAVPKEDHAMTSDYVFTRHAKERSIEQRSADGRRIHHLIWWTPSMPGRAHEIHSDEEEHARASAAGGREITKALDLYRSRYAYVVANGNRCSPLPTPTIGSSTDGIPDGFQTFLATALHRADGGPPAAK